MKKNILKVTLVAALALVAGYNVYTSQKSSDVMSELALANIEALSQTEGGKKGCKLYLTSICETSHGDRYLYRNKNANDK